MRTVFSDCTPSTAEPMSYTNTDTNDCTKDRGIKYNIYILYIYIYIYIYILWLHVCYCYYLKDPIVRTVFSDCTPSTAEPMSNTNTDTNDCTKDRGIKYKKIYIYIFYVYMFMYVIVITLKIPL